MEIVKEYVGRDDARFPARLVAVTPPVQGLWYKGQLSETLFNKTVAVVGSRRMSRYGKQALAEIVPRLVEEGYTTVSGFMYGIDIEMHRLTIEAGGKTIGVFGWGIDAKIIPENINLYNKVIESKGLFLSEYPPGMLATLWSFPQRNRIVVGLADLVIVVEASMKSGSLNSAEWAAKMGKTVYAVPGSIFSPVSSGCNWLIAQGLARPFTLDFFEQKNTSEKVRINRVKHKLSKLESIVITRLTLEGPQSMNEISRGIGLPVNEIAQLMIGLCLKAEVTEEKGVWQVA